MMNFYSKYRKIVPAVCAIGLALCMAGCGKGKDTKEFMLVDGKIIKTSGSRDDVVFHGIDSGVLFPQEEIPEAGTFDASSVTDGISAQAVFDASEEYNSLAADVERRIDVLKTRLTVATDACRNIYLEADKGETMNITLSRASVGNMAAAIAAAGYSATDSLGNINMAGYELLDDFASRIALSNDDLSGTYFIVYPDGHVSGFMLSRENRIWHVYSASAAWNDDGSIRIYSEGRYAVGSVRYTNKGWLIYSRDTSDFDENQKANTDSYVMIRVKPYDTELRELCRKYVEPVGYFENNLFTTTWNEADLRVIDFNSLYAYIFSLYNGTDMLSSYNVRNYYKAVSGSRLYLVPREIFENNTLVYFNIDRSVLREISDYSRELEGYFFLGYDRDYYNVTPRTPTPEVVSCRYNGDGSITMLVDAVNRWYGTDCAFRHELTVRPNSNGAFTYVSNLLYESEENIYPAQKLAEMLNVERTKTTY